MRDQERTGVKMPVSLVREAWEESRWYIIAIIVFIAIIAIIVIIVIIIIMKHAANVIIVKIVYL